MKYTYINLLIDIYERRYAILLTLLLVWFFGYLIPMGCKDQRKIDNSTNVCRGVITRIGSTRSGSIIKYQFEVNGKTYIGAGGSLDAEKLDRGDSIYVKYVPEDPSLNQSLYSPEYSSPPNPNGVRNILIVVLSILGGFFSILIFFIKRWERRNRKKMEESDYKEPNTTS